MQSPFPKAPDCPLGAKTCPLLKVLRRLHQECRRLLQLAQTDPLTGLFNRRCLLKALEREMERTRRTGLPTSLIMIDLDHFKRINDTFGHHTGDQVLRAVSRIWSKNIRQLDILCRYGGEEFAIILPGTRLPQAVRLAERLQAALAAGPVCPNAHSVAITASFGVASFRPEEKMSAKRFLARADRLLLQAKMQGRNNVQYQDSSLPPAPTGVTQEERLAFYTKRNAYEQTYHHASQTQDVLPDQRQRRRG